MTSRELQIFMMVAECGKMSEAAKRMYITQSSDSQAVASIEKEYGILLFERLSNSLYITVEGKQLLSYARGFFSVKDDMENFLTNASSVRRLRIGATVTVGTCVISPILKRVKEELPGIDVSVSVANTHIVEEKLLSNEIDVGLVEGHIDNADLVTTDVISDRLVLVCPPGHRFASHDCVELEELTGEEFILREVGSGTRALFEEQMNARNLKIDIKWSCYNSEAIKNAVMDGHGLSVISRRLVREEIYRGRLHACDIHGIDLSRHFSVVYHKNKYMGDELKMFMAECRRFAEKDEY